MKAIATEESIRRAYKQLKEEGKDPSVENIRKLINGGSNSTIYKILRMIIDEAADTVIEAIDPEKESIIKEHAVSLVSSLYDLCRNRANSVAKAQYRSLADIDKDLDQKLKRLDEIEEQAEYKIIAAEATQREAVAKLELMTSKLQTAEKELKQRETEVTTLKQQYKADIAALKQQREAEVTALKKQHEAEITALNQQIKELKQALEDQQHTNKKLDEILTQVQSNNTSSTPAKAISKQNKKVKQEV